MRTRRALGHAEVMGLNMTIGAENNCGLEPGFFRDVELTVDHANQRWLTQRGEANGQRLCLASDYESFTENRCALTFTETFQARTENSALLNVTMTYDLELEGTVLLGRPGKSSMRSR